MKKVINLILLQAVISLISGILFSQMSFVGKIGITVAYREYTILKTWWKAALMVFAIQLALVIFLWFTKRFSTYKTFAIINLIFVILGLIGLLYTFYDFTNTSHKYMNGKFHMGGYLIWAGWFISCIYFFFLRVKPKPILPTVAPPTVHNKTEENSSTDPSL